MRNASLYNRLKEYCKTALAFLEKKVTGPEDLPTAIEEQFEFREAGEFSQSYITKVEWSRLVSKNEENLTQMDVYRTAVEALEADTEVARHLNTLVGTAETRIRVDADTCLRSLLTRLLEEQQGFDFHEPVFDRVYKGIEDYFYRDWLEYRCLSPLSNFEMEAEKIELSPKFSIIKIPKEEREEILSQSRQLIFPSYQIVPFNQYAFESYIEVPKIIGDTSPSQESRPSQIARKQFDEAGSALRLFKNGTVSYNEIRVKSSSWQLPGGFTIGLIVPQLSFGTRYVLSKEEIPDLLNFWNFFQRARRKKRNRIEVALRRFNFGYGRITPEDKLIDCLIAFEALLLRKEERQELEYRLALRGSVLLGKTPDGRKRVFEELKTAYRERSNIVHGVAISETVKMGAEKVQFGEFVDRVEQHLRSALREFLGRSETRSESEIINDLEERIIGGAQS